jgi:hypothetical protein
MTDAGLVAFVDAADLQGSQTRFRYAACEHSLISPPRIGRRLIRAAVRSTKRGDSADSVVAGRANDVDGGRCSATCTRQVRSPGGARRR